MENLKDLVPELIDDFIKPAFLDSSYSNDFSNYTKTDKHFQEVVKKIIEQYNKKSKFKDDIENSLNDLFE
jgi:hypothetical protein